MSSTLRIKRSSTKTIVDAGSLLFGELVYTDVNGNLYIADKDNAAQQIGIKGTTAAFTTDKDSKLSGIEAGADVTDADNVAAAGAVMEGDTSTASMSFVIDEDEMTSNLDTKVPTQQSVKAYVDTKVAGAITSEMTYMGGYDAENDSPHLDSGTLVAIAKGDMYTVTSAGTFYDVVVEPGDVLIANVASPDVVGEWTVVQKNLTGVVFTARQVSTTEGLTGGGDLSADRTLKLDLAGLTALAAADVASANDVLAIYDLSATTHKKITVSDLMDGGTF